MAKLTPRTVFTAVTVANTDLTVPTVGFSGYFLVGFARDLLLFFQTKFSNILGLIH